MENHHFLMGKLNISMAIFNSYVKLPEGKMFLSPWAIFDYQRAGGHHPIWGCSIWNTSHSKDKGQPTDTFQVQRRPSVLSSLQVHWQPPACKCSEASLSGNYQSWTTRKQAQIVFSLQIKWFGILWRVYIIYFGRLQIDIVPASTNW